MKKKNLGNSDIKVSAMGMGCWGIGGPFCLRSGKVVAYGHIKDKDSIAAIQKGLEMGISLFDTSDVYGCGRSERVLGQALKGNREDVVIATKFGSVWNLESPDPSIPCQIVGNNTSQEYIVNALEGSLERLQTDYIDLYQLHTGSLDPEKAPDVMETLEELVDEGRIRGYGWSTDDPDRAKIFAEGKHCIAVQFRHNITSRNLRMITEVNMAYNIAGLIKGPLGYGLFTGKYQDLDKIKLSKDHMWYGTKFGEGRPAEVRATLEEMRSILTSDGRSLAQAALGWIWAQNDLLIPIPGFKSVQQVEENVKAMNFGPLSANHLKEIDMILLEAGIISKQSL
jgi:aryl-alcohol dehydrogenase-like predicted oxidoreductase